MSNYIIILIIFGISHTVCSDLSNVTYDESYSVCPVDLFRRKRAPVEYTRWRANQETTQEFLVKVLDDELTTPITKQIVAINIQPVTKSGEKIIVGGVIIPPVTIPQTNPEGSHDYTRFVPPTTTVPLSHVGNELFLAQAPSKILDKIPPIKPKAQSAAARNAQRDESPPASPQFIARTPASLARQYAPIAPVAFTRRSTITPLKPTSSYDLYGTTDTMVPTRTSEHPLIMWPTRTEPNSEEIKDFHDFINEVGITRSTFQPIYNPHRTSTMKTAVDDPVIPIHTERNYEDSRKYNSEIPTVNNIYAKSLDKDVDNIYNMMFYGDEENDSNNKKEQNPTENYEDKLKLDIDFDRTSENNKEVNDFETANKTTLDDDEGNNGITKNPYKRVFVSIDESTTDILATDKKISRPICNLVKIRQSNFNSLRTLPEIVSQLKQWGDTSPLVKWEDITSGNLTTMENPIYMVIVDDPSSGQILSAKQTVMIVAGIQGRDHHAVAAAMYVLYQLIERSESHKDLLTKYRFWIIPVFNPDGYDYSMTFPHRREWSKNLRQNWEGCRNREPCATCEIYGLRCTVQPCYGVNLDRNFEYQWIPTEELRAEHPCGSLHAGTRQLSEAETQALTHFLHKKKIPLYTFIAFKEGEVLGIMYPYSHTKKLRAFDHVYRQRASRAASAAYSISGRPYVAGQTSEFLPLYAGGMEDWVDGHLGIDNTYTIMMFRPTDSYNSKLITERVVHEAYAAMDTLLLQSVEPLLGPPSVTLKRVNGTLKQEPCLSLITFFIVHSIFRLTKYR